MASTQGVYKSGLTNCQEISRTHFKKKSIRFLRDKPNNIKMQVKFVMSEDLLFLSFRRHLPGSDANPRNHSLPEDFPMYSELKID